MFVPNPPVLFIATNPADFRKSFDGLSGLVRMELKKDPTDGSLYVFFNKRRDQVKLRYYHSGGICIWIKRLEQGIFAV